MPSLQPDCACSNYLIRLPTSVASWGSHKVKAITNDLREESEKGEKEISEVS